MKIKYSSVLIGLLSLTYISAQEASLTPPKAKAGECYARVILPAKYETVEEKVLIKEASETISIVPAEYVTVEEEVEVVPASKRLIPVPETYKEVTETIEVKPATRQWKTSLKNKALPVSQAMLDAIKATGVDIDNAAASTCYKEYVIPEKYKIVTEDIIVQNERNKTEVIPPDYEIVEKTIEVVPASKKITQIPAEYEETEGKVLVEEEKTVWEKGQNPAQAISGATGEIMCLVKVPAKYKTIKKRVLKNPATTETVDVPAETKIVEAKKLLSDFSLKNNTVPAVYKTIKKQKLESKAVFKWQNTSDEVEKIWKATGNQICVVEKPAVTTGVIKKVLDVAASVQEEEIPATYEAIKAQKLVAEAKEIKTPVEAEYKMVKKRKKSSAAHVGWERILCRTNMNRDVISKIQTSLKEKGYNAGKADGVLGKRTKNALSQYQKDNSLSTGGITYETLGSLNIEL